MRARVVRWPQSARKPSHGSVAMMLTALVLLACSPLNDNGERDASTGDEATQQGQGNRPKEAGNTDLLADYSHAGRFILGPDGRSEVIQLPTKGHSSTLSVAVRSLSDHPTPYCLQLEHLQVGAQTAWIDEPSNAPAWDPYCTACTERASIGLNAGFFHFPNAGIDRDFSGGARLIIGTRDCRTFRPADESFADSIAPHIDLWWRQHEPPPAAGQLDLHVVALQGSRSFEKAAPSDPVLSNALKIVTEVLKPAQVQLGQVSFASLAATQFNELVFASDNRDSLRELTKAARATVAAEHNPCGRKPLLVVLAPCIRYATLEGEPQPLQGLCPWIPGGLPFSERADLVLLQDGSCKGSAKPGDDRDGEAMGWALAHELGHFLGLYHSTELQGGHDHLSDTDEDNLMHPLGGPGGLTPKQLHVIRHHPSVCPI